MDFEELFNEEPCKTVSLSLDTQDLKAKLTNHLNVEYLETKANSFEVSSALSAREGLSMSLQARKLKQALETSRKEIVQPHTDFSRAVNKLAKDYASKLEQIENSLKEKIENWQIEKQDSSEIIEVEDGKLSTKSEFKFEVEDFEKVPREFLVLDELKVKKLIKAGIRNIEGLKIYETKTTTLRVKND